MTDALHAFAILLAALVAIVAVWEFIGARRERRRHERMARDVARRSHG